MTNKASLIETKATDLNVCLVSYHGPAKVFCQFTCHSVQYRLKRVQVKLTSKCYLFLKSFCIMMECDTVEWVTSFLRKHHFNVGMSL